MSNVKLVQTHFNVDGTIRDTKAIEINPNRLKRLVAPGLTNTRIYELKKTGKVEIQHKEGSTTYVLVK